MINGKDIHTIHASYKPCAYGSHENWYYIPEITLLEMVRQHKFLVITKKKHKYLYLYADA